MNSKRKTMLVAAFVVAVVALAGVGYATAVGYKATTTTAANSVEDSQYLIIKADDSAYTAFTKTFAFDTVTTYDSAFKVAFGTCYDISGETATQVEGQYTKMITGNTIAAYDSASTTATYKAVKVKEITATVDFTKAGGNNADLKVTISGLTTNSGNPYVKIVLVKTVGNNESIFTLDGNNSDTTQGLTASSNSVTYAVYLAVPFGPVTYTNSAGIVNDVMTNATFAFEATSVASA